jgi:hypothetical protein
MKIRKLENKIPEVWAAARVIAQHYGHTKKFAKHIVAFAIKQEINFRDVQLAEFLGINLVVKILGYKKSPHPSLFSKVRRRADLKIFQELYAWIIQDRFKGRQIKLTAQEPFVKGP